MKYINLIIVFTLFSLFACNTTDDLFEIMPQSDIAALEGMSEAYESALLYNDSLQLCSDEPLSCDSATTAHYDEFFHQFESMFFSHHEEYSHNNVNDDHHHEGGSNIWHGWMMDTHDEEDEHEEEDEHGYEHNSETMELMMDLMEIHEEIHPG